MQHFNIRRKIACPLNGQITIRKSIRTVTFRKPQKILMRIKRMKTSKQKGNLFHNNFQYKVNSGNFSVVNKTNACSPPDPFKRHCSFAVTYIISGHCWEVLVVLFRPLHAKIAC